VSGLQNQYGNGNSPHGVQAGTWITGTRPVVAQIEYPERISLEQRFAEVYGPDTPHRSLELGTEADGPLDPRFGWGFGQTIAHSRTGPLAKEINPRVVFFRLFGASLRYFGASKEMRAYLESEHLSLLDSVQGELDRLMARLG